MTLALGDSLKIRSMVYVAAEPIPYFWPMRSFIHHNPLHGLEHLPFEQAAQKGAALFHGRSFLPRASYQRYLAGGQLDTDTLQAKVEGFANDYPALPGIDLKAWLWTLLTRFDHRVITAGSLSDVADIARALRGEGVVTRAGGSCAPELLHLAQELIEQLLDSRPFYESLDALYGTGIGEALDELVIRACLAFFDEGQSVWSMPNREKGLFVAWRELSRFSLRRSMCSPTVKRILRGNDNAESVIAGAMQALGIPEDKWTGYFTCELSRLHGWSGFIRWRASAGSYHWSRRFPGDLVDLLAVRLTLALGLLHERRAGGLPGDALALRRSIEQRPREAWLRHEFHGDDLLPAMAARIERALLDGREQSISEVFDDYIDRKRAHEAIRQARQLNLLARENGVDIRALAPSDLEVLIQSTRVFEQREGMFWLEAMEASAIGQLLRGLRHTPPLRREKRSFVQAMFCIDTRSERIRRHLEGVGDYQTYGTAGFFGVPVSFMELGKGSENQLCPVLLTPKNLVLEMTTEDAADTAALGALEKALHGLKESVLTPFVTVEAVGLLFGFDMVGKTLAPKAYSRWRERLHQHKPPTHLLLDKLSREQADSVVRAAQRAVIVKALEQELGMAHEQVTDDTVRHLRELAMGHESDLAALAEWVGKPLAELQVFIERLQTAYRINPAFARLQFERLGRIGFSFDEQVNFVAQALRSIGLTEDFSRFVLLVGHGSCSENNPYESALDCGACGGDHGLTNARVLSRMANKPEVRQRLREQGIKVNPDAWFIPALHNTTTDELTLHDLDLLPSTHLVYLDRLRSGLSSASRLCAQERIPELQHGRVAPDPASAYRGAQRNALDWSQVRPEWGLSGNAYFIIGRRCLTEGQSLAGRAFLHSYDYRVDRRRRLLENILTGPLVVGQWINMEHYFSTVDNERFGSGSKVFHNVAGRFGVMTGNLSDLRTGLPSQTVLDNGQPHHQPLRLITMIEAPLEHARRAVESVVAVKQLVRNTWIRLLVVDPESHLTWLYDGGEWLDLATSTTLQASPQQESTTS